MVDRENVTVTVTIDADLLAKVDSRAEELDLNRSQYFRRLAREDLDKEGKLADKNQLPLSLGNSH